MLQGLLGADTLTWVEAKHSLEKVDSDWRDLGEVVGEVLLLPAGEGGLEVRQLFNPLPLLGSRSAPDLHDLEDLLNLVPVAHKEWFSFEQFCVDAAQ